MRILNFYDFHLYTWGWLEGLAAFGHEVHTVNPALAADQAAFMAQKIDEIKPHIVTTFGTVRALCNADALWPILKQKGVPHVYIAAEDPPFFDVVSMDYAPHADFVFTVAEECVPRYRRYGIQADLLEFACNPRLHHRSASDPDLRHDIILISHNYVSGPYMTGHEPGAQFRKWCTENLVLPLVHGGYDMMIWGDWWDHPDLGIPAGKLGGRLDYSRTASAYSSAKIVLANQWEDTPGGHVGMKTFEILGSGAFLVTPYTPAQARHFTHGRHLCYSRSAQETLALVDHYLAHAGERDEIAAEGQREVYARHTYLHRAADFTEKLRQANLVPPSA